MTRSTRGLAATAAALAMAGAAATPAAADSVADFYKGKQITMVVGYGTGGGFDVYARLVARHIVRFIPGNPTAVVQNMPGAGSLRAVNHLYNLAPKDGTVMAHFSRNMPLLAVLGNNPNARFDAHKFTWLGSSSSFANDAYILVAGPKSPIKSIEDARRPGGTPIVLGGSAEGSTSNDVPVILRDTIGLNYKLVAGYPDSAALFLATERAEVDGRMVDLSGVKTIKPQWLKPDSGYKVLVQFGRETRLAELGDVPTARELALNPSARALIELTELPYKLSRPFAAPPGVPEDRARALQAAFLAAHQDPQFRADADKANIDISPVGPEAVTAAIRQIEKAPPELFEYLKKLFAANKG
jgi:tripartite-type tricarboxylate transporter receptor subunit TctC